MILAPYRALFRIAFKNSFAYRITVLTGIAGSLFFVLAQIAVWTYVFRRDQISTGKLIARVSSLGGVRDLAVTEPDIEDVVRDIYTGRIVLGGGGVPTPPPPGSP